MTDSTGQKVIRFVHFRHVDSHFGFLYLVNVEKDGIVVPKKKFLLQKNSLISKWTQINDIHSVMEEHEFENNDYLKNVLESFDSMVDLHDSPYF